ncbi:rhamnan synthesis F family protein [Microbacterium sp. R86528]|uniref:rhamnan synthesis F family protein n=1 Tax=Microbacterium sp. R86528 TaxID=3093864 RepID=UPI0037C62A93
MSEVSGVLAPSVFPDGGRRLVVYVVYDRRGEVEDFVVHALAALREHAAHVLVVANGSLSAAGREKLAPVSDSVLVRENVGYDIWAHKEALEFAGDLSSYDEIVLANDTWYGPVRPFGPLFERMDAREVHFWGMTDHAEEVPNPFTGEGRLAYHLQSFWIAVRRDMFLSETWASYWRDLPAMPDYFDAVLKHEAVFTEHFTDRGFTAGVAFGFDKYPTTHPALFNADLLIEDGCPLLKRRPLFHYPPFLDRHAVIGRWTLQTVEKHGYPMPLIWDNLARNVPPRVMNADAAMLEVLPDVDISYDPTKPFRIAAVIHIRDIAQVDELLDRFCMLPSGADLFLTTVGIEDTEYVRDRIARRDDLDEARCEVRMLASGHGRDMAAFFIACRDVIDSERYDLVVKLHSMKRAGRDFNSRRYFRRHQIENIVSSAGYFANLQSLFQREPGLGVVFPPMAHIGRSSMGRGWAGLKHPVSELCKQLGIRVPLDDPSPLAPIGGMWVARPDALGIIAGQRWSVSDYPSAQARGPRDLARMQERLIPYAAGERGYHCRTVLNLEHAAISHTALEDKVDQMFSTTPGYPVEQIQFLHRAGWVGHGGPISLSRMYLRMNRPRLSRMLEPIFGRAWTLLERYRRVRVRLRGKPSVVVSGEVSGL